MGKRRKGSTGAAHETFEHTADWGIRVRASDLPALLRDAALALAEVMVEPAGVRAIESWEVQARASERAGLLRALLEEVLFRFEVDGLVPREADPARVLERPGGEIEAALALRGERFDPKRHVLLRPVKAVTYHGLLVKDTPRGLVAEVVVDL